MCKIMCNKLTGHKVAVKKGYSFTTLFFSVLVPLWRNDLKGFLLMLVFALLTGGTSLFIFPFFYNGMYINSLKKKGYVFIEREKKIISKEELNLRKEINSRSFLIAFFTVIFFVLGLLVLMITPMTGTLIILSSVITGIILLIYNGYCYLNMKNKKVK